MTWYHRNPDVILRSSLGLSFEARASFSVLVDLCMGGGRSIADDARWISGVLGCSLRKWSVIAGELVQAGKLDRQNGVLRVKLLVGPGFDHPAQERPSAGSAELPVTSMRFRRRNRREISPKPPPKDGENAARASPINGLHGTSKNNQLADGPRPLPLKGGGRGSVGDDLPTETEMPGFLVREPEGWNGKAQAMVALIGADRFASTFGGSIFSGEVLTVPTRRQLDQAGIYQKALRNVFGFPVQMRSKE